MKTLTRTLLAALVAANVTALTPASAGSPYVVSNDAMRTECSDCHMPYAPGFLPKRSWRAIMSDLPNHFGEDASLGDAVRQEITDYLVSTAYEDIRGLDSSVTPLRITDLPWYRREHGARLKAYAEASSLIGTLSNCTACHTNAERGYFED